MTSSTDGIDPTRCQAVTRQGEQCSRRPQVGSAYCSTHSPGGLRPLLSNPPDSLNLYLPHLPPSLRERFVRALENEGAPTLEDDLALLSVRVSELLDELSTTTAESRKIRRLLEEALREVGDYEEFDHITKLLNDAIELLSATEAREQIWQKIETTLETRRRFYETQLRTETTMTLEQMLMILLGLRSLITGVVSRHVESKALRDKLLYEISSGVKGMVSGSAIDVS